MRTYSPLAIDQVLAQVRRARRPQALEREMPVLLQRLERDETRIRVALGGDLRGRRVLELGPGQDLSRARYLGLHNEVTGIDLDVIPRPGHPGDWLRLLRRNGLGRAAKTLGRKVLGVARRRRAAWEEVVGRGPLPTPRLLCGDVGQSPPPGTYDVIVTWSVFEHLTDPAAALRNLLAALAPGGVLYVGVHLYAAYNGHHDIRAFTGGECPPWAHLIPETCEEVRPSAHLNRWRLQDWRSLFAELAPGHREFLEDYGSRRHLTPELRARLGEYEDEELLTVDAFYLWRS